MNVYLYICNKMEEGIIWQFWSDFKEDFYENEHK